MQPVTARHLASQSESEVKPLWRVLLAKPNGDDVGQPAVQAEDVTVGVQSPVGRKQGVWGTEVLIGVWTEV